MNPEFAIKLCYTNQDVVCGLCGRATQALKGPELVVRQGDAYVCDDCGEEHAPTLLALVMLGRMAFNYSDELFEEVGHPFDDEEDEADEDGDGPLRPHGPGGERT